MTEVHESGGAGREGSGIDLEVGGLALLGLLPAVGYRVDGFERRFAPESLAPLRSGGDHDLGAQGDEVAVRVSVERRDDGAVLRTSVRNLGRAPIELLSVTVAGTTRTATAGGEGEVLRLGGSPSTWSCFRNGWGSFATARTFRLQEEDHDPWLPFVRKTAVDPETPRRGGRGRFRSQLVGALADTAGGGAMVAGFVEAARAFGVVDLDLDDRGLVRFEATCGFDGAVLGAGGEVVSEPLLVLLGTDGVQLLERWASELGTRMDARVATPAPNGWCSWYYYFHRATEADVRENLAAADRLESQVHLDYVMVDDGHQRRIGDWLTTSDRYPSGMAALAEQIRATGRRAGLWLAPFIADPRSDLVQAHPDWVLRDARGRPVTALWNPIWNRWRSMVALDTTRSEVRTWLRDVVHHIRHEWGYDVLKLDFSYAAALPGRRSDPASTRATALRLGLEAIRAGAGEHTFLLGCGMPLGPAVGIVDGMRISTDVAPFWSNRVLRWATGDEAGVTTRGALRNVLTRSFLHGRLWANDPDCVMVRTDRTKLTEAEVRTQAVVAGLTDGMLVSSDRLVLVPEDRLDLLGLAARLAGGRCRVVDLFERELPELVVSEHDEVTYVGAFNLGERARPVVVDTKALGLADGPAVEVLSGAAVVVVDGRADLGLVEPHGSRVLEVRRNGT